MNRKLYFRPLLKVYDGLEKCHFEVNFKTPRVIPIDFILVILLETLNAGLLRGVTQAY